MRLHLCADLAYQAKLLRFIENHDEPRAAATFSPAKERAAAVTIATLPGARLFHEGQFEGRKVRLPVFLARRPAEPTDKPLQIFYHWLLDAINAPVFREGQWALCKCTGWPDNSSYQNLVAWSWVKDRDRYLIIVNLSDSAAQAVVQAPWDELRGKSWRLVDVLSGQTYERNGDEMRDPGLYVDLKPWNCHFFRLHAVVNHRNIGISPRQQRHGMFGVGEDKCGVLVFGSEHLPTFPSGEKVQVEQRYSPSYSSSRELFMTPTWCGIAAKENPSADGGGVVGWEDKLAATSV